MRRFAIVPRNKYEGGPVLGAQRCRSMKESEDGAEEVYTGARDCSNCENERDLLLRKATLLNIQ